MQQANEGMLQMKGYSDPKLSGAFQVENERDGEMEASILGNSVTSQDLQKKQEQLEQIEAFNFFSQTGKKLSDFVSSTVSAGVESLSELINRWFE